MRDVARMAGVGLMSVGTVLTLFVLIGALTVASRRAAGTIPAITCWSANPVSPRNLAIVSFLLTAGMSMLVGSLGRRAATVGVICMTIATAMRANAAMVGGAILAGAFVETAAPPSRPPPRSWRASPRRSCSTTCAAWCAPAPCPLRYAVWPTCWRAASRRLRHGPLVRRLLRVLVRPQLGRGNPHRRRDPVLSLLKVSVKKTMVASLVTALLVCVFVQHVPVAELPAILVMGYHCKNLAIARMVNGGGIVSMLDIALIVATASTYSGIFEGTGLLLGLRDYVNKLARHSTPFVSVLFTSIATCTIACDQVVALMLTAQLCQDTEHDGSALALDLENSAAIIPSLIPWSTSCVGIIAFVGMPMTSILWNCLAYLIPLWTLVISMYQHAHRGFTDTGYAHLLGLDRAGDDVRRFPSDGQRRGLAA